MAQPDHSPSAERNKHPILERLQTLLPPSGPVWECTTTHPPVDWVDFGARATFDWTDWRQAFLDKFAELRYGIAIDNAKAAAA